MFIKISSLVYCVALWVLIVMVSTTMRGLLPVDETRYLSVAWEMWISQDFIVPRLNGSHYSHKPPLLFWLIHMGWSIFGVNDWWPRLVAPIFGLGCVFLTYNLAKLLWPEDEDAKNIAPVMLLGCLFWSLFCTLTMFDLILTFFVLLGCVGLIVSWRGKKFVGFFIIAISIGLGGLTKGPAIFVHLVPVALCSPMWKKKLQGVSIVQSLCGWYFGFFLALLIGMMIILSWAIPAGYYGGEIYRNEIFFGQTFGRVTKSFAHERSWWWYLPTIPLLLLPWTIWPPIWRGFFRLKQNCCNDGGVIFCLIWFVASLLIFSLISGKQLHYLLPEFPAIVLLGSTMLTRLKPFHESLSSRILPALLPITLGVIILASHVSNYYEKNVWLSTIDWGWAIFLIIIGIWVSKRPWKGLSAAVRQVAIISTGIVVVAHLVLAPLLSNYYDVTLLAQRIKIWQKEGYEIANFGKYHGQYNFVGRLEKPITTIGVLAEQKKQFLKTHPKGLIIAYYKKLPASPKPVALFPFRKMTIAVWDAKEFIKNPRLGDRRKND